MNYVPRGTFERIGVDLDNEFKSPLSYFIKGGNDYYDVLSCFDNGRSKEFFDERGEESFADAMNVLCSNADYPVAELSDRNLDEKVAENYRKEILESCEISIKYKGYIEREQKMAEKIMRLENLTIPENFDFDKVESLSIECRQKLKRYSPRTIAQASRISGVSPADISVLLVYFGR
ncbi:MAG: hypothetical protein IAC23_05195 [Bacteroidetes bacterium]|uniref:tRNA uridine 5-carboxymethylaminomethyl modification enzyme C-terminal subdomain domain-containing protein n=1 Tax=Candidatus Cryptobacteroides merdavium TaxID=2840769 RepID=A0A9D9EEM4_9BACT|nr:hypothetical protein [Candidatus Cryptobacteroides merdavium]